MAYTIASLSRTPVHPDPRLSEQDTLSARTMGSVVLTRVGLGGTEDVDWTPLDASPSAGFEIPKGHGAGIRP